MCLYILNLHLFCWEFGIINDFYIELMYLGMEENKRDSQAKKKQASKRW